MATEMQEERIWPRIEHCTRNGTRRRGPVDPVAVAGFPPIRYQQPLRSNGQLKSITIEYDEEDNRGDDDEDDEKEKEVMPMEVVVEGVTPKDD